MYTPDLVIPCLCRENADITGTQGIVETPRKAEYLSRVLSTEEVY